MKDFGTFKKESGDRGIDRISHLFLTNSDPEKNLPHRSLHDASVVDNSEKVTAADTHTPLYTILSPVGMMRQGSLLGCLLALSMAKAGISVGLVETTTRLPHSFFLFGGYQNIDAVYWETDPRLPEFLNMIVRFQKNCDLLVLNVDSSVFLETAGLRARTGRCLFPTTVQSDALLNTYGTIKNVVVEWGEKGIEIVVFKNRPTDKAGGAAVILEKMARRFLSCETCFIGSIPAIEGKMDGDEFLSASFLKSLPENVTAAARDIACNLMQSDGFL